MALPFDDFFRRMTGAPMQLPGAQLPGQPVNAQTPTAATVAGPALQATQSEDYRDAMLSRMGQLGMLLVAAGQRMTPKERATILAQAPQYMDGVQRDAMTAAQARLMNMQTQSAQDEKTRQQTIQSKLGDPAFLKSLGIPAEQAQLLGVSGVMKIMESRLGRDPVQEAYMLNQIQQSQNPKWQITGQDDFGRPRYDLVAPGGDIVTPQGANRGGSNSIMEQLGNVQGPAALEKLKQINPAIAAEVAGIVNAQQPFPSRKLGTPEGAMLNSLVSLVDPNYNANTFQLRTDTQKDFQKSAPSSAGGQRQFGNVGLKHMAEIYNLADKLPNHTNWGPLNSTINALDIKGQEKSATGGDVRSYKLAVINGFDEIAKALGIGTGAGQQELQDKLEAAQGPTAIKQVIKQQAKLLKEKLDTLQERWTEQMGPAAGNYRVIDPEAEKALGLLLGEGSPDQAQSGSTQLPNGVRSIRRIN